MPSDISPLHPLNQKGLAGMFFPITRILKKQDLFGVEEGEVVWQQPPLTNSCQANEDF